jgi:hypothetical protein
MNWRTTNKGTQPEGSASRALRTRAGPRQSLPRRERFAQVQGMNEQEEENIDQPSDEDENTAILKDKIGHLTNYGQNDYFWTFWTFSHGDKSRNDTKPILMGRRDLRVSADSVGRREFKNRKFIF